MDKDIDNINFSAYILNGYSFRHVILLAKNEKSQVTMILFPDKIKMSFINKTGNIGHVIDINVTELSEYYYDVVDVDGNLLDCYPINLDMDEFCNVTKGILSNDSIRFYLLKGENRLHVQPIKSSNKDPCKSGASYVTIFTQDNSYTQFQSNAEYKEEPNVKVLAKDFSYICSQVNATKCSTLRIRGENNIITFEGISSEERQVFTQKIVKPSFTKVKNEQGRKLNIKRVGQEVIVDLSADIVKNFTKLHNISPSGTMLYFYFTPQAPIKVQSRVGTYGTYTLYLR